MICLVVGISGCAKTELNIDNDKINITATIFPQYDFARQIAGDKANVSMLLPPGGESHTYEPSPQDIMKIQNSDIFIYTGGESDSWIDEILKTINSDKIRIINLVQICDTLEEESVDGMQLDDHAHEHDDEEHFIDEHVWTSPVNAVKICDEILNKLCQIDKENAKYYEDNHREYTKLLYELDNDFAQITSSAKNKTLVFGGRFPFRYFTERYGLDYYAAFPGCAEETEASISTITSLIDIVKEKNIPVILYPELSNHKLADTIAEETGTKAMMLHSCHNVTPDEFAGGVTYAELMRKNVEVIREALN